MALSDYVTTFGQDLLKRYGERVHKLTINAGFTCPNRDGAKGHGGCTFCNNESFNPNAKSDYPSIAVQMAAGRKVVNKRLGSKKFMAYFQAYTNTYDETEKLAALYEKALMDNDVVGLAVGTRPDCVADSVLDLLNHYQRRGYEVWLELGLQSAFDETLAKVQRGHGFAEYAETVKKARARGLPVCTHLIIGLPDEGKQHALTTLDKVLTLGTDGLKLHPLHVVKHTYLAKQWRDGEYQPMTLPEYIDIAADLIERTPQHIVYHRVTGTASMDILLAPEWCSKKWKVLNGIEHELKRRGSYQGCLVTPKNERKQQIPAMQVL
jgi:radical SAM protein (TIGR01212 family)